LPYAHFFLEHQINGCRLLMLLPEDLEKLNITKIGHQEMILDAIDHLRHLHYSFTTETLQTLALRLGCKSRSLYNLMRKEADCGHCSSCLHNRKHEEEQQQLAESMFNDPNSPPTSVSYHHGAHHSNYGAHSSAADRLDRLEPPFIRRACRKISTNTLSGVCDILLSVKQFASWIDKDPFDGQDYYIPIRKTILAISIELASTAQRDHFVESPKEIIKSNCLTFAEICDRIVQELSDSLAIQPAVLEMVPIKKRPEEEFGMNIVSSYSGKKINFKF
jgi:AraC-like DNA-binding protein